MSRDGSSADHRKSFVRACFKITVARLNAVEGREGELAESWWEKVRIIILFGGVKVRSGRVG